MYQGSIRAIVIAYKYRGYRALAPVLAEMLQAVGDWEGVQRAEVIAYVPSMPLRRWQRGYHPAELIAQLFAGAVGLPMLKFGIRRGWGGRRQVGLDRPARIANAYGRYGVRRPEEIASRNVLLVDDIYTTGATLSEISRVLHKHGAGQVFGVTVARR